MIFIKHLIILISTIILVNKMKIILISNIMQIRISKMIIIKCKILCRLLILIKINKILMIILIFKNPILTIPLIIPIKIINKNNKCNNKKNFYIFNNKCWWTNNIKIKFNNSNSKTNKIFQTNFHVLFPNLIIMKLYRV